MTKQGSKKLRAPTTSEWIKFSIFTILLLLVLIPLLIGLFKGTI